jgi:hypothetical protein
MNEQISLTRIEAVFIESNPFSSSVEPGVIDSEYALLPAEFLEMLAELYCRRDDVACWLCREMVGYVLIEQPNGFEHLEWRPASIAREVGGHVAVLCEPCAPFVPPFDIGTLRISVPPGVAIGPEGAAS